MRIAVITGASSGLGKEYVYKVAKTRKDIDKIWIIARRGERLEQLKNELGDIISPFPLDITDTDACEAYKKRLETENVQVDLLINNAGYGKLGDFDEISEKDNTGMVRLNCEALTFMTCATLPYMPNKSEIINTCSIASFAPNTRMAVYCSTKAYVMSLSRCLKSELKKREINVLAVCPGPMDTEFLPVADITAGASKTFDSLPRVDAGTVAEKSLIASKKGKGVYTNRLFYKFYRFVAKVLPHGIVMKMSGA